MPTDLPTTAIGLIAFVIVAAGYALWKVVTTFMTYIEKKNNNLEKATTLFVEANAARDKQIDDMLIRHDERHGQMMDDMAARLEQTFAPKK